MGLYLYRLIGAATLDAGMYEGIEHDRSVTWQAALTVFLASVSTALGVTAWYGFRPGLFVGTTVVAMVGWMAWAVLTFEIGSRLLPESDTRTDLGELLRTIGFAAAPALLQGLAVMPAVAIPIFAITSGWMFVAMIVAVRHALDYHSTARAIAVCGVAAALCLGLALAIAMALSRTAYS